MSSGRFGNRRVAFVLGVAIALGIIGLAVAGTSLGQHGGKVPPASRNIGAVASYCGGSVSSADEVERSAPFTLLLPADKNASRSSLTEIDWCPHNGYQAAMQFESGVRIDEEPSQFDDPAAAWAALVKAYPDQAYKVGLVREQPALVSEPGADNYGLVEWVESGTQIKITGNQKIALTDLEAIADSLAPVDDQSPSPSAAQP